MKKPNWGPPTHCFSTSLVSKSRELPSALGKLYRKLKSWENVAKAGHRSYCCQKNRKVVAINQSFRIKMWSRKDAKSMPTWQIFPIHQMYLLYAHTICQARAACNTTRSCPPVVSLLIFESYKIANRRYLCNDIIILAFNDWKNLL